MPYIIETFDKPDHQAMRRALRAEHLAFLARNAGRLLACGAKLDDDGGDRGGGLYIVDTDERAEAEALIAADPCAEAGLFERVLVTRWRKAYLGGTCYLPG